MLMIIISSHFILNQWAQVIKAGDTHREKNIASSLEVHSSLHPTTFTQNLQIIPSSMLWTGKAQRTKEKEQSCPQVA